MSATFQNGDQQVAEYGKDAQEYLSKRGLDTKRLPICMFKQAGMGLFKKTPTGEYEPFMLKGWAILIRGPSGDTYEDRFLLRPMNWPDEGELYKRKGNRFEIDDERPKFVACGIGKKDMNYFTVPYGEMVQSDLLMIHEKYTSAIHFTEATGYPSLALSGCSNWSQAGQLSPTVRKVVENLPYRARVAILFDGDIQFNMRVKAAASKLRGWITQLRPDLETTVIPQPPLELGLNGFDDWCSLKLREGKSLEVECLSLLDGEGLDVTAALPTGYLVQKFGLAHTIDREGNEEITHSTDNYFKLLSHDRWASYVKNVDGSIYDMEDFSKSYPLTQFTIEVQCWLESQVFFGRAAERIAKSKVKDALHKLLLLPSRNVSIPLEILKGMKEVTRAEAEAAAHLLCTKGMGIKGPMTWEENVETWLRMATDIVSLWTNDPTVKVDWICALLGPSGVGKSYFPHNFFHCISGAGYPTFICQLPKSGSHCKPEEMFRKVRDNLVAVLDEYKPEESKARYIENMLLTLSTLREDKFRKLNEDDATAQLRHACIFLTTTDQNMTFINSAADTGERRFITFEVSATSTWSGAPCMDGETIKKCGAILLRWGYQQYMLGKRLDATEFSRKSVKKYIDAEAGIGGFVQDFIGMCATFEAQNGDPFKRFYDEYYREHTGDVRFSLDQFASWMMGVERRRYSRHEREALRAFVLQIGGKAIGKARVGTKDTVKDNTISVANWEEFKERLLACG